MPILAQPLHKYQDGDTIIAAAVEGGNLVFGETRNEEHAAEGRFALRTVIPLQEAIAIAKAVLAAQMQADEDAWIDEMYARTMDRAALVDDALESAADVRFWRENAYVAGAVKLEAADFLPV